MLNTQVYITGVHTGERQAHSFTDRGRVQCMWKERGGVGQVHTRTHTHRDNFIDITGTSQSHFLYLSILPSSQNIEAQHILTSCCHWALGVSGLFPPGSCVPHEPQTAHSLQCHRPLGTRRSPTQYMWYLQQCVKLVTIFLGFHANEDLPYDCWVWKPCRLQPSK